MIDHAFLCGSNRLQAGHPADAFRISGFAAEVEIPRGSGLDIVVPPGMVIAGGLLLGRTIGAVGSDATDAIFFPGAIECPLECRL